MCDDSFSNSSFLSNISIFSLFSTLTQAVVDVCTSPRMKMTTHPSSANSPTSSKSPRTLSLVSHFIRLGLQFSCQNTFFWSAQPTQHLNTPDKHHVLHIQSPLTRIALLLGYTTNGSAVLGLCFLFFFFFKMFYFISILWPALSYLF